MFGTGLFLQFGKLSWFSQEGFFWCLFLKGTKGIFLLKSRILVAACWAAGLDQYPYLISGESWFDFSEDSIYSMVLPHLVLGFCACSQTCQWRNKNWDNSRFMTETKLLKPMQGRPTITIDSYVTNDQGINGATLPTSFRTKWHRKAHTLHKESDCVRTWGKIFYNISSGNLPSLAHQDKENTEAWLPAFVPKQFFAAYQRYWMSAEHCSCIANSPFRNVTPMRLSLADHWWA